MSLSQKVEEAKVLLDSVNKSYAPVVFANSFGAEDMVLTDLIGRNFPNISMFTLDTERLPEETHSLMKEVEDRYNIETKIYFPESVAVKKYVVENGLNGFYDSIAKRKACCFMRKVEPLKRALKDKRAWITGLRRDQALTRRDLEESEFDADNGLQKISPLLNWSLSDVWAYIKDFNTPYNALHDQGYSSIGCAPCTRAITLGEDVRAGRWWWEDPETKECGLHLKDKK
jgi:phosphoadenosine phosphosulfate reductase